jgi:biotin carboxylase
MTGAEVVFVLHAMQPLTADPVAAVGGPGTEVVVLSSASSGPVIRDPASTDAAVHRVPAEDWAAHIAGHAAGRRHDIVTNDEYCLTGCAELRAAAGLPARHPKRLARYLNKVTMKQALNAGDVPTGRYLAPDQIGPGLAKEIVSGLGLPAVVKPRQAANSRGIEILRTRADVTRWLTGHEGPGDGWHVEEYLAGTQFHANAIVEDGVLTPVLAGRYAGPLLGFGAGTRVGSATLDPDGAQARAAHELNAAVVAALGGEGSFVVHTEFVARPDGRLAVLEVAARAPGAGVPDIARLHAGLNLEQANLAMQAGLPHPPVTATGVASGWVWVPVMPGETFGEGPEFGGESLVHIKEAGRAGNTGTSGKFGASVLLWTKDAAQLDADMRTAMTWDWTR